MHLEMDKVVLVEGVKWEQPAGPRELNALRKSPVSLTPFSTLFVPLMWSNQFVSILYILIAQSCK